MVRIILSIAVIFIAVSCGGEIKNVSFSEDVKPIIDENCLPCHNGDESQGKLNFSTYNELMSSRYLNRSEPLAIEGDAAQSRLYLVVHSSNPAIRMPPENKGYDRLNEREIKTIKVWINEGIKNN